MDQEKLRIRTLFTVRGITAPKDTKKIKPVILRSIKIPIHIPYLEPCQTSIMDLFCDNS